MGRGLLGGKDNKKKKGKKGKKKNNKKKVKGLKIEKQLVKKVDKALSKSGVIKPLEELRDSSNLRSKSGKVKAVPYAEFKASGGDVQFVPHIDAANQLYPNVVIHEQTLLPMLADYNELSNDTNMTLANLVLMATAVQSQAKTKKEVKAIRSLYKNAEKSIKAINKLYNKKVDSKLEKPEPKAKTGGKKKPELE